MVSNHFINAFSRIITAGTTAQILCSRHSYYLFPHYSRKAGFLEARTFMPFGTRLGQHY